MSTFALVHGGWHGAWCWTPLAPFLRERGHRVVAMDLPCEDPNADFDSYADVVCEALGETDGDVVVVGHSLGGLTIPLVAARRPVRHLVYLCALLPQPGRSWAEQVAEEPDMLCPGWDAALTVDGQGRTSWTDADLTRALLYADCDEAVTATAMALLKPQAGLGSVPCSLAEMPSVRTTSVICADDRMLAFDWGKRTARDRLGADVVELPGSHSPFLSRPRVLADELDRIARRRASPN